MSNIHHANSEPEINSYQRQQPRRFKKTADAEELVPFPIEKLPVPQRGTGKSANTAFPQKIVATESRPIPRRLLRRTEAAIYIGVSASKFDELVKDGRMPHPKRIDSCVRWDIRQLDPAIDKLPGGDDDDQNEWDEALP